MWFRSLTLYRVPAGWDMSAETLAGKLQPQAFTSGSSLEETSIGWVPPREGHPSLVCSVNGQMLIALRQEKKLLPAKVVTQVVKQRAEKLEEENGFKPGRRQLKELKEQVRDELLPRAFALASDTRVWIDPVNGWLVLDAGSAAKAEAVFTSLLKAIDRLPAKALRVTDSVAGAMTAWLATGEAPAGFTVDQDAELRARDGKATIRYANQSLEQDDITRHTDAGKLCTKLALTWADRVSFMLTDKLEIKRVKPLDVLKESEGGVGAEANAHERFDSDLMLMTGELAKMLAGVVDALGGELQEAASAPPTTATGQPSNTGDGPQAQAA